jgi:biotin synthase-like enzyme
MIKIVEERLMEQERLVTFEQGPIRPPSEGYSLLIRVTRNCTWNKCTFCATYKDRQFSKRSVEEVKKDIRAAKNVADDIKDLSWRTGQGGEITRDLIQHIFDHPQLYGDGFRSVALWLFFGGKTVFLQDANSIVLNTDELVEILTFLKEMFPQVSRITSYARSKSISKGKTVEDLALLLKAGLNRLHVGLESGYDPLLAYMKKGVTAAEHLDAGKKVRASGIELSEYVILGLGGRRWWKEHAIQTARVLNEINPDFIRLRSLKVTSDMPLCEQVQSGEFDLQSEEEVVREERLFIEHLEGITSHLLSDHVLNLIMEVQGVLPANKPKMLATIDRFLNMPEHEKLNFRLGKRAGIYDSMDDMSKATLYARAEELKREIEQKMPGGVEDAISRIKETFL